VYALAKIAEKKELELEQLDEIEFEDVDSKLEKERNAQRKKLKEKIAEIRDILIERLDW